MANELKNQSTDATNSGFGLEGLSENQGEPFVAATLVDGGDSQKGAKQPNSPQHQDV
jgi:hypothetical protein